MSENALTITQQYPEQNFNLLVPMKTVAEIATIHKPVMNCVTISTDLNDKEIYEQEKASNEWTGRDGKHHPASPAKYALTKKGLTKLMRAAGIKIVDSKSEVPSTCQKCATVNAAIGKPVPCGRCGNKDVKYMVKISVPQLTGENIIIVAHKEINIEDTTDGMTDAQKREFMKFRSEMCESKALNRALRAAMQIKGTYTIDELKKPFVVAYLVPNLDNADVKAEAVKKMFGSAEEIYGAPKLGTSRTVYVDDDYEDDNSDPKEIAQSIEPAQLPAPEKQEQRRQAAQEEVARQQEAEKAPDYDPTICTECGAKCSNGVVKYSQQQYGRTLCMACQRKLGGE